jgi:hypothetical protein
MPIRVLVGFFSQRRGYAFRVGEWRVRHRGGLQPVRDVILGARRSQLVAINCPYERRELPE